MRAQLGQLVNKENIPAVKTYGIWISFFIAGIIVGAAIKSQKTTYSDCILANVPGAAEHALYSISQACEKKYGK